MTNELLKKYAQICIEKDISYKEAAVLMKDSEDVESSIRTIRRKISEFIKENEEDFLNTADFKSVTETEEQKVYEFKGRKSITSKKEAIDFFKINLEEEEVSKCVYNSWDVTTSEGKTYTNYQVKIETKPKKVNLEKFYKQILKDIEQIGNKPKTIIRSTSVNDRHLLVIDPADIHIGKLCSSFEVGDDYNNQIAIQRVLEGVHGILDKTRGFQIDKIVFIGGNDVLHVDNSKRTTTAGTPQDTDGMWHDNFLLAKELYIDVINILLSKADVHFIYNPSNHDYITGFFLADVVKTYFKDVENIIFDTSPSYRKYFKYHNNLIGTTHGDGAKHQELPLLMADECKYWSECNYRYIYTHHVHHKFSKDYVGVTVESVRSPSGTDSWHHKKGHSGVPKAIEGFIHHPDFGQISRLTHIF